MAASNGNEVAALERERMAVLMSPAEISRAQEMSLDTLAVVTADALVPQTGDADLRPPR